MSCKYCGEDSTTEVCEYCQRAKDAVSKIVKKNSISVDLHKLNPISKDEDFMEVTEWSNAEGVDVYIYENKEERTFSLDCTELEVLANIGVKLGLIRIYYDNPI